MSCTPRQDLCVTRGSRAEHMCTLRTGFSEVIDSPTSYRGRLVIREQQDDLLPEVFAITVTPEVLEDPAGSGKLVAVMDFKIAGSLTAILPDYDIVGFVELVEVGGDSERLYDLRVRVGD